MALYVVSYDLIDNKDYSKLHTTLESYPEHKRIVRSTWVIASNKLTSEVYDHLTECTDSDDILFVARLADVVYPEGILDEIVLKPPHKS